jgi:ribosome-binding factor A
MSRRSERVANVIRNTVGQLLLTKLSDPRIDPALVSVTRVVVPEDLLTAKVYVSVVGTESQQRTALRALRHAAGRIQELMMQQIQLRYTPVLDFALDEQFKKTLQTYLLIDQAMAEIRAKTDRQAGQSSSDDDRKNRSPGEPNASERGGQE